MFFILAKTFWFLLQPSSLILALLIAGTVLAYTAWRRVGRGLLWAAIGALIVCGLSPLGDILIRPLEQRFSRPDLDRPGRPVDGIVVLGGAEDSRAVDSSHLPALNEAAERYTEAVALARRFPAARLVFSGGSSGVLFTAAQAEAEAAGRLFEALGIPRERITLESKSRDTCENAAFTARMLNPQPGKRWLLVTSAAHMPRAVGCFRRAKFRVEPWPVDYRATGLPGLAGWQNSIPKGLRRIDAVTREYAGLLAYYLAGRTDALFPAP